MASAIIKLTPPIVVTPPQPKVEVILTLTVEQAIWLKGLTGKVTGSAVDAVNGPIFQALSSAGISDLYGDSVVTGIIHTKSDVARFLKAEAVRVSKKLIAKGE